MRNIISTAYFLLIALGLLAQDHISNVQETKNLSLLKKSKQSYDTSVLGKWPVFERPLISNDGKYVAYSIRNQPGPVQLQITSLDKKWQRSFSGVSRYEIYFFSKNGRRFVFKTGDTLVIIHLGEDTVEKIPNVKSLNSPKELNGEWVSYQVKSSSVKLILYNLISGYKQEFDDVRDYQFDDNNRQLLLVRENRMDSLITTSILIQYFDDLKPITIWSSQHRLNEGYEIVSGFSFDNSGNQITFLESKKTISLSDKKIWYYKRGMAKAIVKVSKLSPGVDSGWSVDRPVFNRIGNKILFNLTSPIIKYDPLAKVSKVAIWHYKDVLVQPEQFLRSREFIDEKKMTIGNFKYLAVVDVNSDSVIRIEYNEEKVVTSAQESTGYVVLYNNVSVEGKTWWKFQPQSSFYLVSLLDGKRELLKREAGFGMLTNFSFSPSSKYLVYWDAKLGDYISYDIKSHVFVNITKKITNEVGLEKKYTYSHDLLKQPIDAIPYWFPNDSSLLVYGDYDIWKLDASGMRNPINFTSSYGKNHHVKLRLVYEGQMNQDSVTINGMYSLLLTGFNVQNKYNGFFSLNLDKQNEKIELLTMQPKIYYIAISQMPFKGYNDNGMIPMKANDVNIWLVKRQSAKEAPNYFWTEDFKTYFTITDMQPQADYNWLTTELISWRQPDGQISEGILYKPENFNPQKKYPLIIQYYKQYSHRLNEFLYPQYTTSNANIPWLVNNGYLVFVPDILYSITGSEKIMVGESASKSVISGTQYLMKLPFINAKKIGINGHSVGAAETNYLITKTNIFAAATEFAGVTDPVSKFLTLTPSSSYNEHFDNTSRTEQLSGVTPWERLDLYIKGSTVLNANKIKTPLLIVHNEKDNQIQWRQGIELFMALRRLGKKVWMLQYDEGQHGVFGLDAVDYTIRLTQFFNYYLKAAAPPMWMTVGVPAIQRGINMGYDFDTSGKKP